MYPYIYIVLPSYSVMAFIGGFSAIIFLYLRLGKYEILFSEFIKILALCVIGCYAGSKLLFAITQISWLISNFSIVNLLLLIPTSGFVFYGGLFGAITVLVLYTKNDLKLRKRLFHLATPAFPLFHGFGRIGCFLAGCCYGKELTQTITLFGIFSIDRIPVQLIESAFEFFLFSVLLFADHKNNVDDLLRVYLISYAVFRFFIEFLRGDELRGFLFGISTSQWISIAIIVYYFTRMLLRSKEKKHPINKAEV
ncbi:MAG: prolipoprotein diacylglyceryl transferase [Lachnospiraceae bacterium]|nr:prolipoprotein diacylglyceryl transferase [Lachnospiraceae bacterium]